MSLILSEKRTTLRSQAGWALVAMVGTFIAGGIYIVKTSVWTTKDITSSNEE